MKILIADDEKELSRAISVVLEHSGYEVDCAYDGEMAIEMLNNENYDMYILDIMMPKKSGIEVLTHIRGNGINSPVIMLSAKAEIDDRINGLDAGANDYMTKPFAMGELLARIRAAARTAESASPTLITYNNLTLNKETLEISTDISSLILSTPEFEMLNLLIRANGKELEISDFIEKVWDGDGDIAEVRLYISYLRKKLEALDADSVITKSAYDTYRLESKEICQ